MSKRGQCIGGVNYATEEPEPLNALATKAWVAQRLNEDTRISNQNTKDMEAELNAINADFNRLATQLRKLNDYVEQLERRLMDKIKSVEERSALEARLKSVEDRTVAR